MSEYKTIIHQYCPVVTKNIALEKTINSDNSEIYECLNSSHCKCESGVCENRLISDYSEKM